MVVEITMMWDLFQGMRGPSKTNGQAYLGETFYCAKLWFWRQTSFKKA
jgi:hypothetical protein